MSRVLFSSFDPVAELYHRLWSGWYLTAALPALEEVFFRRVPQGSKVLDLCCGSGHVTQELVRRNYRVTGVDSSAGLLQIARAELPGVDFRLQDARSLHLDETFDAALSTFDSLNHILSLKDVERVFAAVHRCLRPRALFVSDMNRQEAFCADLPGWSVEVGRDDTSLIRGSFDYEKKLARTELIWFHREAENGNHQCWRRIESAIEERCYEQQEIVDAAMRAGFQTVECVRAEQAGMDGRLGLGRIFFTAVR